MNEDIVNTPVEVGSAPAAAPHRPPVFAHGFPPLVLEAELAAMEQRQAALAENYDESHHYQKQLTAERQEQFLDSYRTTLSISASLRRLGVPRPTYDRWRKTDAAFCRQMNELLLDLRQELVSSVLSRAIGHTTIDPATGEPMVDAEGRIVRSGGSDALARSLLGLDKPAVQVSVGKTVVFRMDGVWDGEDDEDVADAIEHSPDE